MKTVHLIIAAWIMLAVSACAQSKSVGDSKSKENSEDARLDNALLWKVSGDDIQDSYVFGTIHLIPAEDYFLPEGTETAFENAEKVFFEIDMNEMTDLGAQMSLITQAFMADGKTLKDLLSDEDYQLVSDHFNEMGMPLFMLERIKPMFLSVFASGDMSFDDISGGGTTSYEMEFFTMAQENGQDVAGLETMAFQMSMFDSIPYTAQAEMLVETIRYSDEENSQFQEMVDVYKSQDIEKLYGLIASSDEGMGEYEDMLVSGRNKNWIGAMTESMSTQSSFFAVGAGHLAGESGVINLLRQAGYSVEAVNSGEQTSGKKRAKKKF